VIDHHASNFKFADINLMDANAPATCQLVYDLLQSEKVNFTKSVAISLFIGLYTDTGGFKYSNTNYLKTLLNF
jgi:phosphoesterase RecJ-like protein